jgi:hypothetical protein
VLIGVTSVSETTLRKSIAFCLHSVLNRKYNKLKVAQSMLNRITQLYSRGDVYSAIDLYKIHSNIIPKYYSTIIHTILKSSGRIIRSMTKAAGVSERYISDEELNIQRNTLFNDMEEEESESLFMKNEVTPELCVAYISKKKEYLSYSLSEMINYCANEWIMNDPLYYTFHTTLSFEQTMKKKTDIVSMLKDYIMCYHFKCSEEESRAIIESTIKKYNDLLQVRSDIPNYNTSDIQYLCNVCMDIFTPNKNNSIVGTVFLLFHHIVKKFGVKLSQELRQLLQHVDNLIEQQYDINTIHRLLTDVYNEIVIQTRHPLDINFALNYLSTTDNDNKTMKNDIDNLFKIYGSILQKWFVTIITEDMQQVWTAAGTTISNYFSSIVSSIEQATGTNSSLYTLKYNKLYQVISSSIIDIRNSYLKITLANRVSFEQNKRLLLKRFKLSFRDLDLDELQIVPLHQIICMHLSSSSQKIKLYCNIIYWMKKLMNSTKEVTTTTTVTEETLINDFIQSHTSIDRERIPSAYIRKRIEEEFELDKQWKNGIHNNIQEYKSIDHSIERLATEMVHQVLINKKNKFS